MTIQRLCKFSPFTLGQRTACRSFTFLILLALVLIGLPALSGAQQTCQPDGDVDQNGSVTAADALLVFQQALGLAELDMCQRSIADVFPQPATPDHSISASDALCIFQKALGLPSCFDSMAPSNQSPIVDAGPDQSVEAGAMVILSGTASDPDGAIASYAWEQTGGTTVSLTGATSAAVMFTAPNVLADETLTFRLTVTDDDGAEANDDVSITVPTMVDIEQFTSVSAGFNYTCGVRDTGALVCWGVNVSAGQRNGQATPPEGMFMSVSTGETLTCGIRDTGEVECWGNTRHSVIPAGTFVSVSVGSYHACGVRDTGAVVCWGRDFHGQTRPPVGMFVSVSAGTGHTCGLRDTGAVECWGDNDRDQSTPPMGTFVSVSAGTGHTCGLRDTGAVECWGSDDNAQSTPPTGTTFASVVLDACTVVGFKTQALWNAGEEIPEMRDGPYRPGAFLTRSASGGIAPAGSVTQGKWNAGARIGTVRPIPLRARLFRSAPGGNSAAGSVTRAKSSAGVPIARYRPRAHLSR